MKESGRNERQSPASAKRRPTLVDVAKDAGVGTSTVSRILNGGHYVEASTLARVTAVMHRLGYRPNQAARALKGEHSHTIGLIVPSLRDEFFAELAHTVQLLAREQDYVAIVLVSADDAQQAITELAVFESFRTDGVILVPPRVQSEAFTRAVNRLGVPVVSVDRPLEVKASSVTCDNFDASRSVTEHLLQHGCRRILCLGGDPDLYTIQERQRGYASAVTAAGLRTEILAAPDIKTLDEPFRTILRRPVNRRPDAIFALLNVASIFAYKALVGSAISIPEEIALVGFDDFPLSSTLTPPVTVVCQPIAEIGRTAVRLLFEEISTGSAPSSKVMIETEVLWRASCGCTTQDQYIRPRKGEKTHARV